MLFSSKSLPLYRPLHVCIDLHNVWYLYNAVIWRMNRRVIVSTTQLMSQTSTRLSVALCPNSYSSFIWSWKMGKQLIMFVRTALLFWMRCQLLAVRRFLPCVYKQVLPTPNPVDLMHCTMSSEEIITISHSIQSAMYNQWVESTRFYKMHCTRTITVIACI